MPHSTELARPKTEPSRMPTRNDILFVRSLRDRNTRILERKFVVEGHKSSV